MADPDNYTDPSTFLSHLQWNPQIEAYKFWPLVVDSTVIVQHISSVIIFVCCFVGIYRGRIPPISVVGWSSTCTFVCWLLWDAWNSHDERVKRAGIQSQPTPLAGLPRDTDLNTDHEIGSSMHAGSRDPDISMIVPEETLSRGSSPIPNATSNTQSSLDPSTTINVPEDNISASLLSIRQQRQFATAKSALLIYSALLGLSPVLKSLTISTTSDSIWALSVWLILMNVLFYDYGGEGSDYADSDVASTRYPSSLSTNAALMASTVLASRLKTTTHVFSLTLFSIQVFGLFPVFRRHIKQRSRLLHVSLTILLILAAGSGLGLVLDDHGLEQHTWSLISSWRSALTGAILWSLINIAAMGGCSWWLISLQKYKNVVIGPWDPAKPIVRGRR